MASASFVTSYTRQGHEKKKLKFLQKKELVVVYIELKMATNRAGPGRLGTRQADQ